MTTNDNEMHSERGAPPQQKGVLQLQSHDALLAHNKIITQQLENLTKKLSQLPKELQNVSQVQQKLCELCGGDHINGQCTLPVEAQEEVNYMSNQFYQGQFNRPPQQQSQWQHISALSDRTSKLEETLQQFMQVTISNHKRTEATIRNLEMQVGQLAKKLEEMPDRSFGANTEKTLPPKFKDPGSFTIPCTIRNHDIRKDLVDLGASINLMPLFMLKKIGGLEVKPTKAIWQMADRSIKHPYGVVEDVVVKIDNFKFLVDFVVMEMEKNVEISLILGRPFMKTTKVVIHVDDGVIMLKDQDEEVTFNVFEAGQPIQVTKTSPKANDVVLSVTGLPDKAAKTVKRNHSCCFPRLKEDDGDKEEKLVHHDSVN
ncbi:uncharacterized protein LOC124830661 [Vigna umbellata]|uniref:uncharacterized protein LOC124830661 n=1 Tax=Vigna umbellata TaxID=87088 RepID=UPI001F5EF46E|nr:uncharacterized protein LOC124830661 [Vigna umbellata]